MAWNAARSLGNDDIGMRETTARMASRCSPVALSNACSDDSKSHSHLWTVPGELGRCFAASLTHGCVSASAADIRLCGFLSSRRAQKSLPGSDRCSHAGAVKCSGVYSIWAGITKGS